MNKRNPKTLYRIFATIALPIVLFLVSAIRILNLNSTAFAPILPFETSGFLALYSMITGETGDVTSLHVILSFLSLLLFSAALTVAGGVLYPRRHGLGMILLLVPIGLDFIVTVVTHGVIAMLCDAILAVVFITAIDIFALSSRENKDLSYYEKY